MSEPTLQQREALARALAEREALLREEVRRGLARIGRENQAELLTGTADAGDESVASLVHDLNSAEVARDLQELRDIHAAQSRMAQGGYGVCIDCGEPIPPARLAAYPTAKRCIRCQEIRERTRA
jgi:phage/conjugal plasmid C-4 type zinc finger TraR family protein